jgi:hypothetical protein
MFKKLVAACAVFAFFACSSDDKTDSGEVSSSSTGDSSSSLGGGGSSSSSEVSSSSEPGIQTKTINVALFDGAASIFGTYAYSYTLKGGEKENLKDYWLVDDDCPTEVLPIPPATSVPAPAAKCLLDKPDAILQNILTNQHSELHYKIDGFPLPGTLYKVIKLEEYNLQEAGDQAALGVDVGTSEGKTIEAIAGTIEFFYKYQGGAHEFRAVTSDSSNFWVAKVPASADYVDVHIPFSDFEGMGDFAANEDEGIEATPFDLSQVEKFLWVLEYDAVEEANNTGSLAIDYLKSTAIVE